MTDAAQPIEIRKVSPDAPYRWLGAAAKDLASAPLQCTLYGAAFAMMSVFVTYALLFSGNMTWMLVLTGGFMLLGPILALGLYQAAKTLEQGGTPSLRMMIAIRPASGVQIAYLGLALLFLYFLWGSIAKIVYMLSTSRIYGNVQEFFAFMTGTQAGLTMAAVGTFIGAGLATIVYAISVIAAPLLYDRDKDIITAIAASVKAVKLNPGAMFLWAALIVALIGVSFVTGFVAFVFVFPWLGLATWHAYRDLTGTSVSVPSEAELSGSG